MESEVTKTLHDKTLAYWNTSSALHGTPTQLPSLTTEKGLKICSDNMSMLNPARPLSQRFYQLQDRIIVGAPRKKPVAVAKVLRFAR